MKVLSRALLVIMGASFASAAVASPYDGMPLNTGSAAGFEAVALNDSELAEQTGTALPARAHYRALSDQYSQGFLQQISQDSRVALDNWWAQTGAALVANSVLSR